MQWQDFMVTALLVMPFLRQHLPLAQPLPQAGSPPCEASGFAADWLVFMSLKLSEQTITCFPERKQVQSSLRAIVGSVSEFQNIMNITVKWVTWIFWFPRAHRSFVYIIVYPSMCAIALLHNKEETMKKTMYIT